MLTIYSKEPCNQCDMAKMLCDLKGVKYETKLLDVDYTKEDIVKLSPKSKSFPIIFEDGVLLGSLLELKLKFK